MATGVTLPESRSTRKVSVRTGFLWFALGLAVVLLVHVVWTLLDDTPPIWDMAYHQLMGWEYLRAWNEGRLWHDFASLSTYYPPLYYLVEAVVLSFLPHSALLVVLTNLPGLLLLSYCTYRLSLRFMDPFSARFAGLAPLLFPLVAWTSREALLDTSLSGFVALAALLLVRSHWLEKRGWSLLFALACAAGMLVKWTFVLFLVPPVLYALWSAGDRKKSVLGLLDGAILATPLVFAWYLPNLQSLITRFHATSSVGNLEGDPGLGSVLAWVYYARCLSSYYLYLPLTLVFIYGTWRTVRRRQKKRGANEVQAKLPVSFLWWWLGAGIVLLTLLHAKDSRYVMPLVVPLAILLIYPWRHRKGWVLGIVALAFLQFLSVSFDFFGQPVKIAFFEVANDPDYQSMRQEWVLYESSYYGIVGPPRKENWHFREMAAALPASAKVGFVPDMAFFHPAALQLYGVWRGARFQVRRLGIAEPSPEDLNQVGFVVGKTGKQGIPYITSYNGEVYKQLEALKWPIIGNWNLPDGSRAMLWRNPIRSQ